MLPLGVVAEVSGSRDRVRKLLDRAGHPQLVLRFAVATREALATPRLSWADVVSP